MLEKDGWIGHGVRQELTLIIGKPSSLYNTVRFDIFNSNSKAVTALLCLPPNNLY
jgi:hypothetical protein